MSGRKNVLGSNKPLAINQSLTASFTTVPTMIDFLDNVGYQINVATTNSTGSFAVQVSLDYQSGLALENANAGNWTNLPLSGTPTVVAANDIISINLNQVPFKAIRLAYTAGTPGTGTANIYIMSKEV